MVLPLIGFIGMICLAVILFALGVSRYNVNAGFAFMILGSIVLLSTSMLVINEGLELNNVTQLSTSGTTTSISYDSVTYDVNTWNWFKVVIDIMFWGSFVGMIAGFVFSVNKSKRRQTDEWAITV